MASLLPGRPGRQGEKPFLRTKTGKRKQVYSMEHAHRSFSARAETQHAFVRPCELRLERHTRDASGKERMEDLCGAHGGPEQGYLLGIGGENLSSMRETCAACPIPDALASRRACLNLVPVRRFPPGQSPGDASGGRREPADAFFPCRWFYPLYGQHQPRDLTFCQGCPHWFPRPPRDRIPGYWPETRKMLRVISGEERIEKPPTGFAPLPRPVRARSWWRRLWQKRCL